VGAAAAAAAAVVMVVVVVVMVMVVVVMVVVVGLPAHAVRCVSTLRNLCHSHSATCKLIDDSPSRTHAAAHAQLISGV
jgi:hypothetical protein